MESSIKFYIKTLKSVDKDHFRRAIIEKMHDTNIKQDLLIKLIVDTILPSFLNEKKLHKIMKSLNQGLFFEDLESNLEMIAERALEIAKLED